MFGFLCPCQRVCVVILVLALVSAAVSFFLCVCLCVGVECMVMVTCLCYAGVRVFACSVFFCHRAASAVFMCCVVFRTLTLCRQSRCP